MIKCGIMGRRNIKKGRGMVGGIKTIRCEIIWKKKSRKKF